MDAQNLTPIRAMDEASVEFRYGMGGDTEKEFIESSDMGQLQGSELESKRQLEREYNVPEKTIADETLGDIMKNTLDFLTYSGDKKIKKVYEAETLLKKRKKVDKKGYHKYMMGFSLFCLHDTNAIYLGIIMIFVSLIIYFMSIVSTNATNIESA